MAINIHIDIYVIDVFYLHPFLIGIVVPVNRQFFGGKPYECIDYFSVNVVHSTSHFLTGNGKVNEVIFFFTQVTGNTVLHCDFTVVEPSSTTTGDNELQAFHGCATVIMMIVVRKNSCYTRIKQCRFQIAQIRVSTSSWFR